MASARENLDKLTKAWIAEGRTWPLLYPMERVEIFEFGARNGVSDEEMIEVMCVLAEHAERVYLENISGGRPQ